MNGKSAIMESIGGGLWPAALLAALLLPFLAGCGSGDTTGPGLEREIVVFGYLYVNETVSDDLAIFLSRTMPVDEYYSLDDAVVTDALVTLWKEGAESPDTLAMVRPGYYANPAVAIEPVTTYHLRVEAGGEDPINATTTTPWPFEVFSEPRVLPDSMAHSAIADSFPIYLDCEFDDQVFLVDAYCLEDWEDAKYVEAIGPEEGPVDYDEYGGDNGQPRHIAPYFRVKGLERENGHYRLGWYGDLFVFYGDYDIQVLSVDENYYNYLYRDHPELNGGVEGGIGVFGSACRKAWRVRAVE
ncbi:MAG: DUF4249 family protein [Candidatus Eisenbacteria bacterium]